MRRIMARAVTAFVVGILFQLGRDSIRYFEFERYARAVAWAEHFEHFVVRPEDFEITQVTPSDEESELALVGLVRNRSNAIWSRLDIRIVIRVGDAQVNVCSSPQLFSLSPGESQRFHVRCSNVSGRGLPQNIRFDARVAGGAILRKPE